ncbi:hypothetical protein T07_12896 [Trichinella nelsoni]|uniref:PiggyBac transposable element-derived protein domain-containing protein n=1 Tax=Trichinella nelsoni TaxID=6336 RepID=A0A0V0RGF7_9BILA|nr:hypothetical protein T07_12896 [Trichinella nelsoni]
MVDRSQEMLLEDAGNLLKPQEGPSDLYLFGNNTPRRPRFQAVASTYGIQHILLDRLFGPLHGKGQDLIPVPMAAQGVLGRFLARGRGSTAAQMEEGTKIATGLRRDGLPVRRKLLAACACALGYCRNSLRPHKATDSPKTVTHGSSGRGETGALRTWSAGPADPLHHVLERQRGCSSVGNREANGGTVQDGSQDCRRKQEDTEHGPMIPPPLRTTWVLMTPHTTEVPLHLDQLLSDICEKLDSFVLLLGSSGTVFPAAKVSEPENSCLKVENEEKQATDEQIIPFTGKHKRKVLAVPADFVVKMCEHLAKQQNHKLFFDNYCSFTELQLRFKERSIWTCGTLRSNRLRGCPLLSEQALNVRKRGGRAGTVGTATDDTDAEMNQQVNTGASSFGDDCGSNPSEATNEPAQESGSLQSYYILY